ncbi:hypothetical protein LCGC14_1169940 [marine sediment metagenome]|uniref:Uncharacterized protein n=1 Tax=marine sediment metagenome TaxID=412755 RepID=A0A0F9P895_9ZZZZ
MSQKNPKGYIDETGQDFVTRLNEVGDALLTCHSGSSSAPSYKLAGTIWLDTAATPWLLKQYDGTDWITLFSVNATTNAAQAQDSDTVDGADAGNASGNVGLANGTICTNLNAEQHNGRKTKEIEIGVWNMDGFDTVVVGHGLTYSKIREVTFAIRNDADTKGSQSGQQDELWVVRWDSTNVILARKNGGVFDADADYDDNSINRGWITIEYVL